jgi:hypothetical protein
MLAVLNWCQNTRRAYWLDVRSKEALHYLLIENEDKRLWGKHVCALADGV